MISKINIKLIKSLSDIKNRRNTGLFVAEGKKTVQELLLSDFAVKQIFATEEWIEKNRQHETICSLVSQAELEKLSQQKTPNQVLAIAGLPDYQPDFPGFEKQLCLVLDNIQDPGNLGTIIRICNWYGVGHVICSPDTVDAFNPKVVQSSMGAIFRTKIYYAELEDFIKKYKTVYTYPVTGAFLDGELLNEADLNNSGLLILGNESKGISPEIAALTNKRVCIPPYPPGQRNMESLNVAVAGAIILNEFRRGKPSLPSV